MPSYYYGNTHFGGETILQPYIDNGISDNSNTT